MKKSNKFLFTILLSFLLSNTLSAQKSKLKIHAVQVGFGGFYFKNKFNESGGALLIIDLTTSYKSNLFSASYLNGSEIGIIFGSSFSFNEKTIQYGRELNLKKWIKFELFAGVGSYTQESRNQYIYNGSSTSFPLKLNTKFYFTSSFGMGFNTNYSINDINDNFSTNLTLHYKF